MNTDALNDFVKISDVDTLLIHEYKDVLPQEIITVWKNYGFGSFMRLTISLKLWMMNSER